MKWKLFILIMAAILGFSAAKTESAAQANANAQSMQGYYYSPLSGQIAPQPGQQPYSSNPVYNNPPTNPAFLPQPIMPGQIYVCPDYLADRVACVASPSNFKPNLNQVTSAPARCPDYLGDTFACVQSPIYWNGIPWISPTYVPNYPPYGYPYFYGGY